MEETADTSGPTAQGLPRRIDVHTEDPPLPEEETLPSTVKQTPVEQRSPAQWAYERLILYIQNFEKQLDDAHEVAMGFTGGEAGVLRIEGMGYFDPDIVTFYGRDADGARTQLVQHVTQLTVMLRAMPKAPEHVAPRRIGFRLVKELEPDNGAG